LQRHYLFISFNFLKIKKGFIFLAVRQFAKKKSHRLALQDETESRDQNIIETFDLGLSNRIATT